PSQPLPEQERRCNKAGQRRPDTEDRPASRGRCRRRDSEIEELFHGAASFLTLQKGMCDAFITERCGPAGRPAFRPYYIRIGWERQRWKGKPAGTLLFRKNR